MAKSEKEVKKNGYFKEMKTELKKVVWPTPKELLKNTIAVIAFVIIIAVIVFVFDLCFDGLNKYGITKLQEKVQSSLKTEDESTESEEEGSSEEESSEESSSEENSNAEAEVNTEANVELENATAVQNSEESSTTEADNQTETVPEE